MRLGFASRLGAIVAREAATGYAGMIKACWLPCVGRVARLAIIGCRQMIDRFSDGWRTGVVVTGEACAAGLRVIKGRIWRPGVYRMTGSAIVRRQEMGSRLAGGRRMAIVVARNACGSRLAVIEGRWCPGRRRVAAITGV